ncbi:MAG: bifunctional folylpolyglutamate synthase/dihydrofolate synthase, partial [Bacteroidales bacterium]|nr:bifunctional folylpolyglutamate synthase/dihydrofolate synthase [Bacteroidales bacterium]
NLDNTIALDKYFNHPHKNFKTIHVAGTNGKGSVSHTLASILQEAGYKTGLYTSPHLEDFRERIRVQGEKISEQAVIDFVENHSEIIEKLKPSFFEMSVAMAFDYFAEKNIDIAVVEVGMGGRLDSTNIISPLISIITNISLDHTQFLGSDLASIAKEKAGIIKPNTPVIIGQTHDETAKVFKEIANANNAEILFADQEFNANLISENKDFNLFNVNNEFEQKLDLKGHYQMFNLQTVLASIKQLSKSGICIDIEDIKSGLSKVQINTGLRGRWQTISENPKIIADAGHNSDALTNIMQQLKLEKFDALHVIIGMANDKDVEKMLEYFPKNAKYYFTKANIPRAFDQNELKNLGEKTGLFGNSYKSVHDALLAAQANAGINDLIFVGGSSFIVAELNLF